MNFYIEMVSDASSSGGSSGTKMRPKEYRNLKPLPCYGTWNPEPSIRQNAVFLAPEQMRIQERVDGKHVAKGVMPIPVPSDLEFSLGAAMKTANRAQVFNGWSGATVTDRTGGIYDNLDRTFEKLNVGSTMVKREIYDALRLKGSCPSPYHGIVAAIDAFAGLSVTGLLIEVADRPSKYSVTLGAAVLVCKEEYSKKWRLTASRARLIRDVGRSDNAKLVKCHMDELIGIAYATGLPIVTKSSLYEPMAVDGLLEKTNKIKMSAPFFTSTVDEKLWKKDIAEQKRDEKNAIKGAAKIVPKAMEIPDASTFLRMKASEKRACLRATGVQDLPRPREGKRALDALMIPLLDEEVAYEVLRRLAETQGDFELAAEMNDFESRKPIIARQIAEARKAGDFDLANELCDELNALSTLKFDPTDPDNPKQQSWDVEEWYWEQRKRVYSIIA